MQFCGTDSLPEASIHKPPTVAIVIPARYASTRLPAKALLQETGKPLIQHVYEQAKKARAAGRVVIATDHPSIWRAARAFGAEVELTSGDSPTGTDRVAEAARGIPEEIIINVQGDEPEIDPEDIDGLAALLSEDDDAGMATLASPIAQSEAISPDRVKVVRDRRGYALYFSRSPIPYRRNDTGEVLGHVGIYAYRREVLLGLGAIRPTPLEEAEGLEQLRALETGVRIRVGDARRPAAGIDTREDYDRFVERFHRRK